MRLDGETFLGKIHDCEGEDDAPCARLPVLVPRTNHHDSQAYKIIVELGKSTYWQKAWPSRPRNPQAIPPAFVSLSFCAAAIVCNWAVLIE